MANSSDAGAVANRLADAVGSRLDTLQDLLSKGGKPAGQQPPKEVAAGPSQPLLSSDQGNHTVNLEV